MKKTNHADLQPSNGFLWYLAYGSNMSTEKFTQGRGIIPMATAKVNVPGWILTFNIPGLPYSEPGFTSIATRIPSLTASPAIPDILGVAYLITKEQFIRILASEGGGIAYESIELDAVPVDEQDAEVTGPRIKVSTLGAAMDRQPSPKPSKRYMDIILTGSQEVGMPKSYHEYLESIVPYEPPKSRRNRVGAAIFLKIWGPIMGLMEKITEATIREDGYAPAFVISLVRFTMYLIWFSHDILFAPVFGYGDGQDQQDELLASEKAPLLDRIVFQSVV